MTTHNDDGFARNVGRMIEKEDEHIEHIDDMIMTKNDTGSDGDDDHVDQPDCREYDNDEHIDDEDDDVDDNCDGDDDDVDEPG